MEGNEFVYRGDAFWNAQSMLNRSGQFRRSSALVSRVWQCTIHPGRVGWLSFGINAMFTRFQLQNVSVNVRLGHRSRRSRSFSDRNWFSDDSREKVIQVAQSGGPHSLLPIWVALFSVTGPMRNRFQLSGFISLTWRPPHLLHYTCPQNEINPRSHPSKLFLIQFNNNGPFCSKYLACCRVWANRRLKEPLKFSLCGPLTVLLRVHCPEKKIVTRIIYLHF